MPKVRIVQRLRSDGDYRREKEEIMNRVAREYEELSKKYTALLESLRTKHHPAVEGTETDGGHQERVHEHIHPLPVVINLTGIE